MHQGILPCGAFHATFRVMTKAPRNNDVDTPLIRFRRERGMSQIMFGAMFDPPVNKSTVSRWEANGVPLERVIEVEKVTGVPRQELAPDMFAVEAS
jgi:hypothetical protein